MNQVSIASIITGPRHVDLGSWIPERFGQTRCVVSRWWRDNGGWRMHNSKLTRWGHIAVYNSGHHLHIEQRITPGFFIDQLLTFWPHSRPSVNGPDGIWIVHRGHRFGTGGGEATIMVGKNTHAPVDINLKEGQMVYITTNWSGEPVSIKVFLPMRRVFLREY